MAGSRRARHQQLVINKPHRCSGQNKVAESLHLSSPYLCCTCITHTYTQMAQYHDSYKQEKKWWKWGTPAPPAAAQAAAISLLTPVRRNLRSSSTGSIALLHSACPNGSQGCTRGESATRCCLLAFAAPCRVADRRDGTRAGGRAGRGASAAKQVGAASTAVAAATAGNGQAAFEQPPP